MSWYYNGKRKVSCPPTRRCNVGGLIPLLKVEVTEKGTVKIPPRYRETFPPGTAYRVAYSPEDWKKGYYKLSFRFNDYIFPSERVIFFGKVTKRNTLRVPKKFLPDMLGSCRARFGAHAVYLNRAKIIYQPKETEE